MSFLKTGRLLLNKVSWAGGTGLSSLSSLFVGLCLTSKPRASQCRYFSVKELSWCAPSGSPNRSSSRKSNKEQASHRTTTSEDDNQSSSSTVSTSSTSDPAVAEFGIVAAMSQNRIIGVRGEGLPWNLPSDRHFFVNLTRHKVLIVGKHTLYETPHRSHLRHARATVVVSQTLLAEAKEKAQKEVNFNVDNNGNNNAMIWHNDENGEPFIYVVESFTEALQQAKRLEKQVTKVAEIGNNDDDHHHENLDTAVAAMDCWVAGGEGIYQEALHHEAAQFVHLTVVNTDIDDNNNNKQVARFPAKYRWDYKYRLVVQEQHDGDGELSYTRYLYQHLNRIRRRAAAANSASLS